MTASDSYARVVRLGQNDPIWHLTTRLTRMGRPIRTSCGEVVYTSEEHAGKVPEGGKRCPRCHWPTA